LCCNQFWSEAESFAAFTFWFGKTRHSRLHFHYDVFSDDLGSSGDAVDYEREWARVRKHTL
jgi:hypothetical protein